VNEAAFKGTFSESSESHDRVRLLICVLRSAFRLGDRRGGWDQAALGKRSSAQNAFVKTSCNFALQHNSGPKKDRQRGNSLDVFFASININSLALNTRAG
jgi:hypothetical protein